MNTTIDIRISRARTQLIQEHPFFGALVMQLIAVQCTGKNITAATDGKFLFYNSRYLDTITEPLIRSLLVHEVLHCALGHHVRRGDRDKAIWNLACDYVVNQMIHDAGFPLHPEWVQPEPRFKGLNAEMIYRILMTTPKEKEDGQENGDEENPGSGPGSSADNENNSEHEDASISSKQDSSDEDSEASEASGGGGQPDDAELGGQSDGGNGDEEPPEGEGADGEQDASGTGVHAGTSTDGDEAPGVSPGLPPGQVIDAAPEHDEAAKDEAAEEWQVYTRQATNIARRQGEGRLPGFIEEIVENLAQSEADWRTVLRRFVDPSATKDYSWALPNRRYTPLGYISPGTVSDGISHGAICVDTSGSLDTAALQKLGGEAQSLLDEGAVDKLTIVFCDTQVNRAAEYTKGDVIDFTCLGRGGTRFSPAFNWLEENTTDLQFVVYMTDLDCTDWGEAPWPVLWAVVGNLYVKTAAELDRKVPFGECMLLK